MSNSRISLGDIVKTVAGLTGASRLAKLYTSLTGKDCGCEERKVNLDYFMPNIRNWVMKEVDVPNAYGKVRIRKYNDGTYGILRKDKETEAFLDSILCRVPGQLFWYPAIEPGEDFRNLRSVFEGKQVYMIGKGPSLDRLTKPDFDDPKAPIICINESIHQVEKLNLPNPTFVLLQDARLKATCLPIKATVIIPPELTYWYSQSHHIILVSEFFNKFKDRGVTAVIGTRICNYFGALKIVCLAFDACIDGNCRYAESIPYKPGNDAARFKSFCTQIKNAAGPLPIEFRKTGLVS
jgi:hypothetical protein